MKIAVFPNSSRDLGFVHTKRLIAYILSHKGDVLLLNEIIDELDLPGVLYVDSLDSADVLICLGGDGTFLSSIRLNGWNHLPTIGVNLGSVGFLPQIHPSNLDYAVDQLFTGRYVVEERMMLDVSRLTSGGETLKQDLVLNDVVIGRGLSGRIVNISLWINNEEVDHVRGDGMIVSTPTGSTAYALSAGGPIVHPQMSCLLITPLCPHSLHNRSYLTSDQSTIRLALVANTEPAVVSIDGQKNYRLLHTECLQIKRADQSFKLIRLGDDRFYKTLSAKIQQRGIAR